MSSLEQLDMELQDNIITTADGDRLRVSLHTDRRGVSDFVVDHMPATFSTYNAMVTVAGIEVDAYNAAHRTHVANPFGERRRDTFSPRLEDAIFRAQRESRFR